MLRRLLEGTMWLYNPRTTCPFESGIETRLKASLFASLLGVPGAVSEIVQLVLKDD